MPLVATSPLSLNERDFVRTDVTSLRVGTTLQAPIFDAKPGQRQLLLAAGQVLSDMQIERLHSRGVTQVFIHKADLGLGGSPTSRFNEPQRQETGTTTVAEDGWRITPQSLIHEILPVTGMPERQTITRFQECFRDAVSSTDDAFRSLVTTQTVDAYQVSRVSSQSLQRLLEDFDLYATQGIQPVDGEFPSRFGVQTAMLATSMGAVMGLTREELHDLGLGCLLHDAGMLVLPPHLLHPRARMSPSEQLDYMKHPLYISDLLNANPMISQGARMVAFQIHERLDGSGFPKQRHGNQIHPLARIAAVADHYLSLVSPGVNDPGVTPHKALEQVLRDTRRGLFHSQVSRALLHTVSLFPLGSSVRLSDGRVGRVVRTNRNDYARPQVHVVNGDGAHPPTEILDLFQLPHLSISAAGPAIRVL